MKIWSKLERDFLKDYLVDRMTKLEIIKNHLNHRNTDKYSGLGKLVEYGFSEKGNKYLLYDDDRKFNAKYWTRFLVAPKQPLYDVEELQEFMLSLKPKYLAPDYIREFELPKHAKVMYIGRLCYYEPAIVSKTVKTERIIHPNLLRDKDFLKEQEFERDMKIVTSTNEDSSIKISIDVYPHEEFLNLMENKGGLHGLEYRIADACFMGTVFLNTLENLKNERPIDYEQPGFFERICGFFKK